MSSTHIDDRWGYGEMLLGLDDGGYGGENNGNDDDGGGRSGSEW